MIKNIIKSTRNLASLPKPSFYLFAKPEKPEKGEKGGKKQQAPAPVIKQISPEELMINYLTPTQNYLSPKQLQIYNQGFTQLSEQQKKYLDEFADEILDLKTPAYLQFSKYGGLGTESSAYVATQAYTDDDLKEALQYLRKQEN